MCLKYFFQRNVCTIKPLPKSCTLGLCRHQDCLIKRYSSTSPIGFGHVEKGIMYVRYRSSYNITTAEWCKLLSTKTLSYSKVKHIPRVPLILLTVEKIEGENFDFLSSFFFLTNNNPITVPSIQIICTPNNCSTIRDLPFVG